MGNQPAATSLRHPRTTNTPAEGDDSTASDDGAVVLPRDVLFEILLRLPAKQLCRLRAVCRSWRSLLSDPLFVAAHGARHPRGHQLFAVARRGIFAERAEVELLDASSGRVVRRRLQSCVGLSSYVLAHQGLICVVGTDQQRLRVVDPLAGVVSLLPDHGRTSITRSSFVLGRAAGAAGDYKVLSITKTQTRYAPFRQVCKVLTLGAGGGAAGVWREAPMPPAVVRTGYQAAVAAGVVYVQERGRRDGSDWIAAFDLEGEQWRPGLLRGPLPRDPLDAVCVVSLGEMDGRLVAVTASMCGTPALTLDDDEAGSWPWQWKCTVQEPSMPWGGGVERVQNRVWVLDGGRVAFLVRSPRRRDDERGCQNGWVLRVYDPTTERCHDVARLPGSPSVGVGLYSANLLSFGSVITDRP